MQQLEAAGVPCAPYNEPGDALHDEHLRQRGLFAQVDDGGGRFTGVNAPWQMSAAGSRLGARVPQVGADTDDLLHTVLGLNAAEIAQLRSAGVFGKAGAA